MLMQKGLRMQKYEFYLEGEHGVDFGIIRATDEKDLIRILKEDFPRDIGADGFYNCPKTGDEIAIDWSL